MHDRYGSDVLSCDPHRDGPYAHRPRAVKIPAEPGLVVEEPDSGFVGAVVRVEKSGGNAPGGTGRPAGAAARFPPGWRILGGRETG